jgi:hypothetical protein
MRRVLFVMTILIFLVAACAPAGSGATEEASAPGEGPTSIPANGTPAQRAAVTSLSETLSIPPEEIKVVSTEAVTWPDGCLGIVRMGMMCTQAEVPGFKLILEANGKEYEFHTNEDGSVVLLAEGAQNSGAVEETVLKQLAVNLGLQEDDIKVISSEMVEFGDACLGVAQEGVTCAQVVTPGWLIVLEANGIQYEYHTSTDGSRVQPATLAMVWKREGGIAGFCDILTAYRSGEVFTTNCKSNAEGKMGTFADLLSATEKKQFIAWITEFGEVKLDASDPQGVADRMLVTLQFFGMGSGQPSDSEQQTLFNFAQENYQKLSQ